MTANRRYNSSHVPITREWLLLGTADVARSRVNAVKASLSMNGLTGQSPSRSIRPMSSKSLDLLARCGRKISSNSLRQSARVSATLPLQRLNLKWRNNLFLVSYRFYGWIIGWAMRTSPRHRAFVLWLARSARVPPSPRRCWRFQGARRTAEWNPWIRTGLEPCRAAISARYRPPSSFVKLRSASVARSSKTRRICRRRVSVSQLHRYAILTARIFLIGRSAGLFVTLIIVIRKLIWLIYMLLLFIIILRELLLIIINFIIVINNDYPVRI